VRKQGIINYCRYVDDFFLIFDSNKTCIQIILNDFNALHLNLQFTAEIGENQALNYLDVTIRRTPTTFKMAIYRKPTFTEIIIPYSSNHPHTTNTLLSDSCSVD